MPVVVEFGICVCVVVVCVCVWGLASLERTPHQESHGSKQMMMYSYQNMVVHEKSETTSKSSQPSTSKSANTDANENTPCATNKPSEPTASPGLFCRNFASKMRRECSSRPTPARSVASSKCPGAFSPRLRSSRELLHRQRPLCAGSLVCVVFSKK